jgi:hypothetical protein
MKTTTSHYLVGYGRPPQQHQYKPGQSGNPTGRPKGARSAMADWRDESAELVSVKVGEQTVQLAQHRALVKETYRAALAGDLHAANMAFNWNALAWDAEQSTNDVDIDATDQAIVMASEERQRQRDDTNPTPTEQTVKE